MKRTELVTLPEGLKIMATDAIKLVSQAIEHWQALRKLLQEHSEWSQATFRTDAERGPIGPLKHLAKEVEETITAYSSMSVEEGRKELADCFLLLLDAMRRMRMSIEELIKRSYDKLQICKTRSYPMPEIGDDNPSEHDRSKDELGGEG